MPELSFKLVLGVAAAGALGTLCRFFGMRLISGCCGEYLPYATLAINLSGSFLAGLFYALTKSSFPQLSPLLPVILIGFMGGFTTFSTFALECAAMLQEAEYCKVAAVVLLQTLGGIAAAMAGIWLASGASSLALR